jgi:hypothetical protein
MAVRTAGVSASACFVGSTSRFSFFDFFALNTGSSSPSRPMHILTAAIVTENQDSNY